MSPDARTQRSILESPEFLRLVAGRRRVSLTLLAALLAGYFGFVLVLAFNPGVFATRIGTHLTLGIPVGVGVIVFAWLLTGVYVWWANRYYDRTVEQIKSRARL
jgi:uncharacterized membrane protein (DUF485 family)